MNEWFVWVDSCNDSFQSNKPEHIPTEHIDFESRYLKSLSHMCVWLPAVCVTSTGAQTVAGVCQRKEMDWKRQCSGIQFSSLWLLQHWKNWLQNWVVTSKLVKLIILTHPSWEYPCMAMKCGERGWLVSAFNRLAQTTAGVYVCLLRWHGVFLAHACTYA